MPGCGLGFLRGILLLINHNFTQWLDRLTGLSDGHSPKITAPHWGQSLKSEAAHDRHMFTSRKDLCSVIHFQKFYDQHLKPFFLFRIPQADS